MEFRETLSKVISESELGDVFTESVQSQIVDVLESKMNDIESEYSAKTNMFKQITDGAANSVVSYFYESVQTWLKESGYDKAALTLKNPDNIDCTSEFVESLCAAMSEVANQTKVFSESEAGPQIGTEKIGDAVANPEKQLSQNEKEILEGVQQYIEEVVLTKIKELQDESKRKTDLTVKIITKLSDDLNKAKKTVEEQSKLLSDVASKYKKAVEEKEKTSNELEEVKESFENFKLGMQTYIEAKVNDLSSRIDTVYVEARAESTDDMKVVTEETNNLKLNLKKMEVQNKLIKRLVDKPAECRTFIEQYCAGIDDADKLDKVFTEAQLAFDRMKSETRKQLKSDLENRAMKFVAPAAKENEHIHADVKLLLDLDSTL